MTPISPAAAGPARGLASRRRVARRLGSTAPSARCWRKTRSAAAPAADPQAGGIVGWLLAKQSEFYREMSATIRAAKSDGSAVWTLLAISFAYGIFHAAGPGHGKAVISSYLVANRRPRGAASSCRSPRR